MKAAVAIGGFNPSTKDADANPSPGPASAQITQKDNPAAGSAAVRPSRKTVPPTSPAPAPARVQPPVKDGAQASGNAAVGQTEQTGAGGKQHRDEPAPVHRDEEAARRAEETQKLYQIWEAIYNMKHRMKREIWE